MAIVLPGQTLVQGTGVTGTPTPVPSGTLGQEDFVVDAVDATFYLVNGPTDTINFSSSDLAATTPSAGTIQMVNGVATVTGAFFFSTSGTFTITAMDATTLTIPNATSSPVVVNY